MIIIEEKKVVSKFGKVSSFLNMIQDIRPFPLPAILKVSIFSSLDKNPRNILGVLIACSPFQSGFSCVLGVLSAFGLLQSAFPA